MKAKLLARSSVMRMTEFFATVIIAFYLTPLIIHSLGDRMYGLWMIVGSFLGFYWFFELGLASAVQRYVSRAIGQHDEEEINTVVNTSLFLYSIIAIITIIATIAIVLVVPHFMKKTLEVMLFRRVIFVMGLGIAIDFPMRIFQNILNSYLRHDINAYIKLFKLLVRTILIVVLLKMGYKIFALACITVGINVIGYIITFFVVKRVAPALALSIRFIAKEKIKPLLAYSSSTYFVGIGDALRFHIDNFVIAGFLGLSLVTVYSIAARLIRYFISFITSAVGILIPMFSQYEAKGDYGSIRDKFVFTTKISSYLEFFVGGVLIMFGNTFIQLWVGPEYKDAYPILLVLVIPIMLALMQAPSVQLVFGISKHKFFAISNLCEGAVNLMLSLILVRKIGLIGVALGTAIPMLIVKIFIQPVYVCKSIEFPLRKYYIEILGGTAIKSIFVLGVFWLFAKSFIVCDYTRLFILICLQAVLFAVVIFFIGLNKIEQNSFKRLLIKTKA